jgi:hypothetical protein
MSTTDAIFAQRQIVEKYTEGLHYVFINHEQTYDPKLVCYVDILFCNSGGFAWHVILLKYLFIREKPCD